VRCATADAEWVSISLWLSVEQPSPGVLTAIVVIEGGGIICLQAKGVRALDEVSHGGVSTRHGDPIPGLADTTD
jgi:hypothetical protein